MLAEVQEHFGFARNPQSPGFYETPYHRQFLRDLRSAIHAGKLIAFTALVGSGKTLLLRQLQANLVAEKRVTMSKSLAVDKDRASLITLTTALFYDLSPEKDPRILAQSEHRERALRDLVHKTKRPVVLFVAEAHDLHNKTLSGLKRLREVVADGDGVLSIVLTGHPRLRNALMWPNMEEVGFRFAVSPLRAWRATRPALSRGCSDAAFETAPIRPASSSRPRWSCLPAACARPCRLSASWRWRSRRHTASASAWSRRRWSRRCCRASSTTWNRA